MNNSANKNNVGNFRWGIGGGRSMSQGVAKVTFKFLRLKGPQHLGCTRAVSVVPEDEVSSFECCQQTIR